MVNKIDPHDNLSAEISELLIPERGPRLCLTAHEQGVLHQGLSNQQILATHSLSVHTVEALRSNLSSERRLKGPALLAAMVMQA